MKTRTLVVAAVLSASATARSVLAQPDYIVDQIEHPANGFALYPSAINNQGVVVGWWYGSPATNREPFVYTQATGYVRLPDPAGYAFTVPTEITSDGVIVGFSQPTWSDSTNPRGWRLENGQYSLFPVGTHAMDINESGLIVGATCIDQVTGSMSCLFTSQAPPAMQSFPGIGGSSGSLWRAIVVNDVGQMAYKVNATTVVFRDTDGTTTPLPSPPAGWTSVRVDDINNRGQVLAHWTRSTSHPLRWYSRGFVWSAADGAREFGISANSNRPKAINNRGQVVVESGSHDQAFFDTWVWTAETGAVNLDDRTDLGSNLVLTDLYDINDAGQILASGDTISPPADAYVILSPTAQQPAGCPADTSDAAGTGNPDGAVDVNDLLYFLISFEGGTAEADLDNDGTEPAAPDGAVDVNDLLFFLARFEAGC